MFHDIVPQAEAAATAQRVQDPCGDLSSVATTIVANDLGIGFIRVPVLLLCSHDDALFPAALCSLQQLRYLASGNVRLLRPADTGHAALLERSAPQTTQQIADWLASLGF
jgi:pimeloyl-ACP methyl ester carboxylesterase